MSNRKFARRAKAAGCSKHRSNSPKAGLHSSPNTVSDVQMGQSFSTVPANFMFAAFDHAAKAVIGTILGPQVVHILLNPSGTEFEDGAWFDKESDLSLGSPNALGILIAGVIGRTLRFARAFTESERKQYVLADLEVRSCAYDLARRGGEANSAAVSAIIEASYVITRKLVEDNRPAINTVAMLLIEARRVDGTWVRTIVQAPQSTPLDYAVITSNGETFNIDCGSNPIEQASRITAIPCPVSPQEPTVPESE